MQVSFPTFHHWFSHRAAIPGPPSRPEVLDVTHEGMTLTWQPPEDDGGSSIAGYIIERKEAHSDRWMKINKNPVTMTRYRSSNLIESLEYEHRVTAINSRGTGKPSESSAITVAMDPIGKSSKTSLIHQVFLCTDLILIIRQINGDLSRFR